MHSYPFVHANSKDSADGGTFSVSGGLELLNTGLRIVHTPREIYPPHTWNAVSRCN